MSNTNLRDIDLRGANLNNASMHDTDITGANLSNSNMPGASITSEHLASANSLKGVVLLYGTKHEYRSLYKKITRA